MDSPSTMIDPQLGGLHLRNHVTMETGNQRNSHIEKILVPRCEATDQHTPPTKLTSPWKRSIVLIGYCNSSSNLHLSEAALGLGMVAQNSTVPSPNSVKPSQGPDLWELKRRLKAWVCSLKSLKSFGSKSMVFVDILCHGGWAFKRFHLEDI